jgi:hypothetical protein
MLAMSRNATLFTNQGFKICVDGMAGNIWLSLV